MARRKNNKHPSTHQKRRRVSARSPNQKEVLRQIKDNDLVFCAGPAGSGKTHLSVGAAIEYFLKNEVERIVVTRPIVQAGERIGFLPGTAEQKLDPYLYPVFDEFRHFMSHEEIASCKNERTIEIVPLALMRGRNFHNAFIIGDEMQNATYEQMKMLITRMGMGSKLFISGDLSQSDLDPRDQGAFEFCLEELDGIDGIGISYLMKTDIVRNPLIPIVLDVLDDEIYGNQRYQRARR
jgi:phosphate starvation-inducible PhoH-like protein|tara:strand:- start:1041 stop:1751 length:711 start_codon:yes stop_codon:yes gene_type:complete